MQYFITATGTDIGKTFVLENICRKLIKQKEKVEIIKPIISGFNFDDLTNDSAKLLKALGRDSGLRNIKEISPYRFSAPLSPNIAANLENKNVNFEELIKFCQNAINKSKNNNHHLFIEGAGGVMTPITHNKSFADLISALEISTILVVGNYLGSISHTLTAIKAMQSYNIKIDKIILNCRDDLTYLDDHIKTLKNFTDVKIVLEF